jgi:hypothetical protein
MTMRMDLVQYDEYAKSRARADRDATDALAIGLARAPFAARPQCIPANPGFHAADSAHALLRAARLRVCCVDAVHTHSRPTFHNFFFLITMK